MGSPNRFVPPNFLPVGGLINLTFIGKGLDDFIENQQFFSGEGSNLILTLI
jgi:hypothetical protein